ncbi:hypothetical protein BU25DRAFT_453742 [Macroventuria anomochaeta]|uniref:Uncharacterized protein n=1 Tax=Macroventuria anomochaeta TaxID=301207 RepID=A0ACB6SGR1_9PLEO|nr:uncharacterized protein BU25DRAFT_453742 [Macroventuria anomochaeta]KAF2632528.1 hypothetical protein BU25DRAFT_453742 [Macroventuria anomochaeta]
MALQPIDTTEELPVIWLAPPPALLPSSHPIAIRPIPIAISATLASLLILVLVILYNKKPKAANTRQESIELATLKNNIHIVRSLTTVPPVTASPVSASPHICSHHASLSYASSQLAESDSITFEDDPPRTPPLRDTPPVQYYHAYLKDSLPAPHHQSATNPPSPSIASYYYSPEDPVDTAARLDFSVSINDTVPNAPLVHPIDTAASSDYSVSIGPTPLPSRQNSLRNRETNGVWTRLRLGPEYDGDRTFVPSEANLQLGKGKG